MGVEYHLWIVPSHRSFRPSAGQVANLANALREGNWVPRPGAQGQRSRAMEMLPKQDGNPLAKQPFSEHQFPEEPISRSWLEELAGNELVLSWDVDNMVEAGVQYPFAFDPWPDKGPPYFTVRIVIGDDYFSESAENVAPLYDLQTKCACGEQLIYDAGWGAGIGGGRIRRVCPKCGLGFDPSDLAFEIQDVWTGEPRGSKGGLNFRFALEVDCGKYFPRDQDTFRQFKLREDFLVLWSTHIGLAYEQLDTMG